MNIALLNDSDLQAVIDGQDNELFAVAIEEKERRRMHRGAAPETASLPESETEEPQQ